MSPRIEPHPFSFEVLPTGGPDGQPANVYRFPVSFEDVGSPARRLLFSRYAWWMGRNRDLVLWLVREPLRAALAAGTDGLVMASSSIDVVDDAGWLDVVEARAWGVSGADAADAPLAYKYAWSRVEPSGEPVPLAAGVLSARWVHLTSGRAEPAAAPSFLRSAFHGATRPAENPTPVHRGRELFRAAPGPRVRPVFWERSVSPLGTGDFVGNVYYANYYSWQGAVLGEFLQAATAGSVALRPTDRIGEPLCTHASVSHLREASPFEAVIVTVALRALYECGADLHFEYFRAGADGQREKLAYGEHRFVWCERGEAAPQPTPVPATIARAIATPCGRGS